MVFHRMLTEYTPDEWEISAKQLELLDVLGEGAFGVVYKAILTAQNDRGLTTTEHVAVKVRLKDR